MRLKSIKLAGFKSFVEPTTIPIGGNLIGIVGPNGCGKSNIIDAVRWVMGEMSAKNLRGDSMADVILQRLEHAQADRAGRGRAWCSTTPRAGSAARTPPTARSRCAARPGATASRITSLNKTRCRRKDITDLFLGTGLGPRAYSIIEQGMVTRIVEAKPEDLRGFLEEAAGISRYKERRKGNREPHQAHAREPGARRGTSAASSRTSSRNCRSSRAPRRATRNSGRKNATRARNCWRCAGRNSTRACRNRTWCWRSTRPRSTPRSRRSAPSRPRSKNCARARPRRTSSSTRCRASTGAAGAEISRLEQALEHARETRARHLSEQEQANRAWEESSAHLGTDRARFDELRASLEQLAPRLAEFTRNLGPPPRSRAAAEARHATVAGGVGGVHPSGRRRDQAARGAGHAHPEPRKPSRPARRTRRPAQDRSSGDPGAARCRGRRCRARRGRASGRDLRGPGTAPGRHRGRHQGRPRRARGKPTSNSTPCAARPKRSRRASPACANCRPPPRARAYDDARLLDWLRRHRLEEAPRLAGRLNVDAGWEKAVEHVLGADLTALCVDGFDPLAGDAAEFNGSAVTFIDQSLPAASQAGARPRLLDRIKTTLDLSALARRRLCRRQPERSARAPPRIGDARVHRRA